MFADIPRCTNLTEHEIKLKEDGKPFKQRAYRLSPFHKEVLKKEVNYLLHHGLAEPSSSPYSSPCVLVKKPDGSFRMCTDYRKLNSISVADNYPLPLIDQLLDNIGQAKFVSKIDLLKGYYQIPLEEKAKLMSAFITPFGLYQYTVMPFGLMNAPATFQRVMDQLLGSIEGVGVYLDDIVIYSATWEEHLMILQKVFKKLQEAGLTINLEKSEFGKATVQYLGFEVGKGLLAPVNANIEGIRKASPPATRKQLQSFIGMAGFYRRFCPNFSAIIAPLTDLTSPKTKFVWTSECQESFEKVKTILTSRPVLQAPDFNKKFVIQVDASDCGIGAVLLQEDDSAILHPVCFLSTKLKKHQKAYSTIEKETLALITALKKFEVYVNRPRNEEILVLSDHNPITFLNKMKNNNQRLTRWSLSLQPYNIKVEHISGKNNIVADYLSRCASLDPNPG